MSRPAPEQAAAGVRGRLAGKRVLLSGGSGFVGKAVLASLLRNAGDLRELVVLLRAPDARAATARLRDEVLADRAFASLPAGEIDERLSSGRVRAVAADLERGDFGDTRDPAWGDIDTVIHCAATVSFEEPLDEALALNTFGPVRLLEQLRGGSSQPHFVHVSTAYVSEQRTGEVLEDGSPRRAVAELDPEEMLAQARGWRSEVEREAGGEQQRRTFEKAAARDAKRRAGLDPVERAEELRSRWVWHRLSRRGRRHAIATGWPDTYALSKALGEQLLVESSRKTTVIRPTIIESALLTPHPGWLEGIKVADPLILAYAGRGLTHLPGRAGNRIDLVPVDHVANACVVAAAHPPEESVRTLAVASSARNPLTLGELAAQIKKFFRGSPLTRRNGSQIEIGDLKFVDREVALRATVRRERLAGAAARMAMMSPIPIPQERALRGNRAMAERVTRMVKIYGAYTEFDCAFDDRTAVQLAELLLPDERAELSFDTGAIDWDDYLQRIHLPQVRELAEGE